jgi:hypothetical protein
MPAGHRKPREADRALPEVTHVGVQGFTAVTTSTTDRGSEARQASRGRSAAHDGLSRGEH